MIISGIQSFLHDQIPCENMQMTTCNHVFPYFLSYAGKLLDVHTKHGKEEIKKNNPCEPDACLHF